MNDELRIRVVGLGAWGTRAAELCAVQNVPARAVDSETALRSARLPEAARHALPSGATMDHAKAARALAEDEALGRVLVEDADADIWVVIGQLGSGAGAHMGAMLGRIAEAAPHAGRLAIARLPNRQSPPDDRALALVALNAVLEAPDSSVLLVGASGLGLDAETQAMAAVERVIDLLGLAGGDREALADVSPRALLAHLSAPGFVGWRETDVDESMCAAEATGWLEQLDQRGVAWQPGGFSWSDAQSVLTFARLPRDWIESGGRAQFDSFVKDAWGEAAPCAIARALHVGEAGVAMAISTGLPYPEDLLELRDSVKADRAGLAEKRRAAAAPIPLGDDFMAGVATWTGAVSAATAGTKGRAARGEPRAGTGVGEVPAGSRPIAGPPAGAGPEATPRPPAGIETPPRPRAPSREETHPAGAPSLGHEGPRNGGGYPSAADESDFVEPHVATATATEAIEHDVSESEARPDEGKAHELAAPDEAPTVAPVPATEETPATEEAPAAGETLIRETAPSAAEPADERPTFAEPRAEPSAQEPGVPAARVSEIPIGSPYETAVALAERALGTDDPATEIDLGQIRYALYDLLEVLRERPARVLADVFRRADGDYFERHHVNVAVLALLTADQLGATLGDIIDLGTAAMLHDIGMSDSREAWDADVRLAPKVFDSTIRQHPERGYERLKKIPGMTVDVARMVLEEHERLDGTGYPEGLAGEAIDPGARILAVCDTLEALTHARPYRERLSLGEALSRLQILGQYTLDMAVVQTLADALTQLMPSLDTEPDSD